MYSVSNRVANKQADDGMVEQLRSLKVCLKSHEPMSLFLPVAGMTRYS